MGNHASNLSSDSRHQRADPEARERHVPALGPQRMEEEEDLQQQPPEMVLSFDSQDSASSSVEPESASLVTTTRTSIPPMIQSSPVAVNLTQVQNAWRAFKCWDLGRAKLSLGMSLQPAELEYLTQQLESLPPCFRPCKLHFWDNGTGLEHHSTPPRLVSTAGSTHFHNSSNSNCNNNKKQQQPPTFFGLCQASVKEMELHGFGGVPPLAQLFLSQQPEQEQQHDYEEESDSEPEINPTAANGPERFPLPRQHYASSSHHNHPHVRVMVPQLTQLQSVRLYHLNLQGRDMGYLLQQVICFYGSRVSTVYLTKCRLDLPCVRELAAGLSTLRHLRTLVFTQCGMTDELLHELLQHLSEAASLRQAQEERHRAWAVVLQQEQQNRQQQANDEDVQDDEVMGENIELVLEERDLFMVDDNEEASGHEEEDDDEDRSDTTNELLQQQLHYHAQHAHHHRHRNEQQELLQEQLQQEQEQQALFGPRHVAREPGQQVAPPNDNDENNDEEEVSDVGQLDLCVHANQLTVASIAHLANFLSQHDVLRSVTLHANPHIDNLLTTTTTANSNMPQGPPPPNHDNGHVHDNPASPPPHCPELEHFLEVIQTQNTSLRHFSWHNCKQQQQQQQQQHSSSSSSTNVCEFCWQMDLIFRRNRWLALAKKLCHVMEQTKPNLWPAMLVKLQDNTYHNTLQNSNSSGCHKHPYQHHLSVPPAHGALAVKQPQHPLRNNAAAASALYSFLLDKHVDLLASAVQGCSCQTCRIGNVGWCLVKELNGGD